MSHGTIGKAGKTGKAGVIGKPGPFQVIETDGQGVVDDPMAPPRRRYDCTNYESCLDLAAALNWDSFTCRGCSGCIDEKLYWRAHQVQRKDVVARKLCNFPNIESHLGVAGVTAAAEPPAGASAAASTPLAHSEVKSIEIKPIETRPVVRNGSDARGRNVIALMGKG